jgi:hypothetical protein
MYLLVCTSITSIAVSAQERFLCLYRVRVVQHALAGLSAFHFYLMAEKLPYAALKLGNCRNRRFLDVQ